jgi:hypothetical protein
MEDEMIDISILKRLIKLTGNGGLRHKCQDDHGNCREDGAGLADCCHVEQEEES